MSSKTININKPKNQTSNDYQNNKKQDRVFTYNAPKLFAEAGDTRIEFFHILKISYIVL